jgi:hypothetical protein
MVKDGCPTFVPAYVGRIRRGEAPRSLSVWLAEETVPKHASSTSNLVRAFETIHFPPRYPGFPVEVGGVDKLHAAFLNESRTRCRRLAQRSRKSGTLGRTWGTRPCLIGLQVSSPAGRQRRWRLKTNQPSRGVGTSPEGTAENYPGPHANVDGRSSKPTQFSYRPTRSYRLSAMPTHQGWFIR